MLWSRIANYDRALLDQVLAQRKTWEHNAFIVTPDLLPELRCVAKIWATGVGDWRQRARNFLAGNAEFHQTILDRLRANGLLQSRHARACDRCRSACPRSLCGGSVTGVAV